MSDFIYNLLNRHIDINNNVRPRIPGRFETDIVSSINLPVSDPALNQIENEYHASNNEEQITSNTLTEFSENNNLENTKYPSEPTTVIKPVSKIIATTKINENYEQDSTATKPTKRDLNKQSTKVENANLVSVEKRVEDTTKHKILSASKHLISDSQDASVKSSTFNDKIFQDNKTRDPDLNRQLNKHNLQTTLQSSDITVEPFELKFDKNKSEPSIEGLDNVDILPYGLLGIPPQLPVKKTEMDQAYFVKDSNSNNESTIKVNIGRIEVRAVMEPSPPLLQRKVMRKPELSLDDYLKQRDGGKR